MIGETSLQCGSTGRAKVKGHTMTNIVIAHNYTLQPIYPLGDTLLHLTVSKIFPGQDFKG